jgi:hypothetical protein
MSKLGYTFYPKDWRSNMDILGLNLQEKGFYRELIDECFIQSSSEVLINKRTFCAIHALNSRSFARLLHKLEGSSLIVCPNFDETLEKLKIIIPSTSKRLGIIKQSKEGGEVNKKRIAKEKEKEKEKEKVKYNNNNIEFEFFWNLYDKKVGDKNKIFTKWNKLTLEEKKLVKNYIPKYKNSQPDKKFRKNPDTFLNQKSWNDEIIQNNFSQNNSSEGVEEFYDERIHGKK